jgi:GT2 family glycosyltransferase
LDPFRDGRQKLLDSRIPATAARPIDFEVLGFGEATPARMAFASPNDLRTGRAICEQEIARIDAAIAREKIPFPSRMARERPRFSPHIRPLPPETANPGIALARPKPAPFGASLPLIGRAIRRLGRAIGPFAGESARNAADAAEAGPLPKISVVTVSFNQASYLEAAIRSVLDQHYPALEYIIVDGGSSDGSVEMIERYRPRCSAVIIEPDRGQSDALNKGFARAGGDILSWLCSDDLLEPGALPQVAAAWRRGKPDLVVGGCVRIGETRRHEIARHRCALPMAVMLRLDPLDLLRFMGSWQRGHYFYQPEVFFSRRIWEASGSYLKRHLHYGMDYDLWVRMALAGATLRHIPPMLACSRVHAGQKTRNDHAWYHQFRQLMEEYRDLLVGLEAAAGNDPCELE